MGTGLGLSIVRSVLEAHGLPYGVVSEPDQGTVFLVHTAAFLAACTGTEPCLQEKSLLMQALLDGGSGGEIRTLDTPGMNRML